MPDALPGIHHITAITGDAQRNHDFYTTTLGLRLVKVTVNFDDPGAYHLYYGDGLGRPGSILTFFVWPGGKAGRSGAGQIAGLGFAVPTAALDFWHARLTERGVDVTVLPALFGEPQLGLRDPDGLAIALVGTDLPAADNAWSGPVPPEQAIRRFHSVTLLEADPQRTARFLTETLGFHPEHTLLPTIGAPAEILQRFPMERLAIQRFASGADEPGALAIVLPTFEARRGIVAAGSIHHVAWRAADDAHQLEWRSALSHAGAQVTPVLDRCYFHSIYFHEPGGALFEIATDPPGFTIDEPLDALGTALQLPSWLEPERAAIRAALPPLRLADGRVLPGDEGSGPA